MTTRTMKHTFTLFAIIIIEGYIVLSTELLIIRQTIPYIGSGTDTISVIIAAVLMPLAFGYQTGGAYKPKKILGHFVTIRKKLIYNFCIAASFLALGLSYPFLHRFFLDIASYGITNRIMQLSIFCALFVVVPVYLLGQTVPLISHFFSKENLPKVTGRILFCSTVGSFLGATLSTMVLMSVLGVHHTLTLNFVLMALLVLLLSKRPKTSPIMYAAPVLILVLFIKMLTSIFIFPVPYMDYIVFTACAIALARKKPQTVPVMYMSVLALLAILSNTDSSLRKIYPHMRVNNEYNLVQAGPKANGSYEMRINGNRSSSYSDDGTKFIYIDEAEEILIDPILAANPPKDILIIGAGGFTFGHNDNNNTYTYVDIDKDLKDIAERHILRAPIGDNKRFVAKPARAFLHADQNKYDIIYLDAYLGGASVPEHLITREFFIQIKNRLKENGVLMTNFIATPDFRDRFSQTLDNTIRSVFPYISRMAIGNRYQLWKDNPESLANISYIYRHRNYDNNNVYTDNKNNVFYEKHDK
ncbi:MAG: fused MFS/spermidine synthase [Alphaproteobacteria bacterium]